MKRSRFPRRIKQTPDSELLLRLSTELASSTSRLEDAFWENRLARHVNRLLAEHDERTITDALDQLYPGTDQAFDALVDVVEACAETRHSDSPGGHDISYPQFESTSKRICLLPKLALDSQISCTARINCRKVMLIPPH